MRKFVTWLEPSGFKTKWYQNEIIQEELYKNLEKSSQSPCSSKIQNSYWKEVESQFGLESQNLLKHYKRIDHYWRQIGHLRDDKGAPKYPQLFALVKCVLSWQQHCRVWLFY